MGICFFFCRRRRWTQRMFQQSQMGFHTVKSMRWVRRWRQHGADRRSVLLPQPLPLPGSRWWRGCSRQMKACVSVSTRASWSEGASGVETRSVCTLTASWREQLSTVTAAVTKCGNHQLHWFYWRPIVQHPARTRAGNMTKFATRHLCVCVAAGVCVVSQKWYFCLLSLLPFFLFWGWDINRK